MGHAECFLTYSCDALSIRWLCHPSKRCVLADLNTWLIYNTLYIRLKLAGSSYILTQFMDAQRRTALIFVTHDVGCASCMCDRAMSNFATNSSGLVTLTLWIGNHYVQKTTAFLFVKSNWHALTVIMVIRWHKPTNTFYYYFKSWTKGYADRGFTILNLEHTLLSRVLMEVDRAVERRPPPKLLISYSKTKSINWKFHSLKIVFRWCDSQLQVSENYSDLGKWR